MRRALLVLAALAVYPSAHAAITVAADFPGGSGEVLRAESGEQVIHIQPTLQPGRGWPCWWYVRVSGLKKDAPVSFRVSAHPGEFRPGDVLPRAWLQPNRAAISVDNEEWTQTPPRRELDGGVVAYEFEAPAGTVWLAWGPPFLPEHADALLEKVAARAEHADRFTLAETREGRPVHAIRIGTGDKARAVWVQARQHAWESGASWVAAGFLEWMASDAPLAEALREAADIYFVPVMDVDNVSAGAGGKEAVPRDHNRDWTGSPHYPEVAAAQERIRELIAQGRLAVSLDLHNPGGNSKQPFFYGPWNLKEMPEAQRQIYTRWLDIAADTITEPLPVEPEYQFAGYITTKEERSRVSQNWVRARADEAAIALTLETAWNTPHSTTAGYKAVGAQLAETVAKFLTGTP